MISITTKKLKYRRKIVIVTNGKGAIETVSDDINHIVKKILDDGMEITILGLDFDDEDYGVKEEDKPPDKRINENNLRQLAEECNGVFGTLAQAVDELGEPRLKETRPVPSYKGTLTLGSPLIYPQTALVIDIERYPRTMIRRPATASSFIQRTDGSQSDLVMGNTSAGDGEGSETNGLTTVRNQVMYQVDDPDRPGTKIDIERDDLARGYEYGRTAVHISESDESITKLETQPAMEIIGFIPWDNYDRYMSLSSTHVVVAQKANTKANMALSSLMHALYELQSFAVVKLVTKADKAPTIELLAPLIDLEFECLIDVQLPFAEDVRSYKFAPLDRVVTVSGKHLKEHRYLPNDELKEAMDKYVDSMDISDFGHDDEGKPAEYMAMQDTFSPTLHRIDQAVRWRAVHTTEPIPPPYEILTRYSETPKELQNSTKHFLDKLVSVADVKKVPPRTAGRKRFRDQAKPLSGLDVNALLGQEKRLRVSSDNPIPSFKQMLDTTTDPNGIEDAASQLGTIIETRIAGSFGDNDHGRAVEELGVFREEMIEMEEPGLWNNFIRALKSKLLEGKLGGDRDEMWWEIRKARLGLVEGKIPGEVKVEAEEAKEFLSSR